MLSDHEGRPVRFGSSRMSSSGYLAGGAAAEGEVGVVDRVAEMEEGAWFLGIATGGRCVACVRSVGSSSDEAVAAF